MGLFSYSDSFISSRVVVTGPGISDNDDDKVKNHFLKVYV